MTAPDAHSRGVRLGVDVGTVRVGVAISDPGGVLASPLATLRRDPVGNSDLAELESVVAARDVMEVVVGLPRTMRGALGPAAAGARAYGDALAARIGPTPVVFVDERLTTVLAHRELAAAGRSSRNRRAIVDQVAAVAILQGRLDGLARSASDAQSRSDSDAQSRSDSDAQSRSDSDTQSRRDGDLSGPG